MSHRESALVGIVSRGESGAGLKASCMVSCLQGPSTSALGQRLLPITLGLLSRSTARRTQIGGSWARPDPLSVGPWLALPCPASMYVGLSLLGQLRGLAVKLHIWESTSVSHSSLLTACRWSNGACQEGLGGEARSGGDLPLLAILKSSLCCWKLLPCYEIHKGGEAGLIFYLFLPGCWVQEPRGVR
jgi:hypothetical protein